MLKTVMAVAFFLMDIVYGVIKLFCPVRHKVVFLSRQSNKPSTDILMVQKRLKEIDPQIQTVILCHTLDGGLANKIRYMFHMLVQMYHIATSEVAVLDSYCIVISCLHHRKSLKVIQMWHGLGCFKAFGYSILNKGEGSSLQLAKAMHMHEKYDYVFTSSEFSKPHFVEGFNVESDQMLIAPLPKVDLLRDEQYRKQTREMILQRYPQLAEKPSVLYVPTFRKQEEQLKQKIEELIDNFDYEHYNLVVSLHPVSKIRIEDERIIQDSSLFSFQWGTVCDKVITDYSSVIYELAIMGAKLYYYVFDSENYLNDRGLCVPFEMFPGPKATQLDDLLSKVYDDQYDSDKVKQFVDTFIDPKITDCCGHICDIILNYPKYKK